MVAACAVAVDGKARAVGAGPWLGALPRVCCAFYRVGVSPVGSWSRSRASALTPSRSAWISARNEAVCGCVGATGREARDPGGGTGPQALGGRKPRFTGGAERTRSPSPARQVDRDRADARVQVGGWGGRRVVEARQVLEAGHSDAARRVAEEVHQAAQFGRGVRSIDE